MRGRTVAALDVGTVEAIYKVKEEIVAEVHKVDLKVASLEAQLKKYNAVREAAYSAKELAEDNEKAIGKLEDIQKWAAKTGIGAMIGLIGKIIYDAVLGR